MSGKIVKVSTEQYKEWVRREKRNQRLAQAQAEAQSQSQDPRFQQDMAMDQFLAEPEERIPIQQPSQQFDKFGRPEFPTPRRTFGSVVSQIGRGVSSMSGVRRQPQFNEYGQPIPQRPLPKSILSTNEGTILTPQSNILNAPNVFNNPGDAIINAPQNQPQRRNILGMGELEELRARSQANRLNFL